MIVTLDLPEDTSCVSMTIVRTYPLPTINISSTLFNPKDVSKVNAMNDSGKTKIFFEKREKDEKSETA